MADATPLPVKGSAPQSDAKIALVNEFKQDEERLLRKLDGMHEVMRTAWEATRDIPYDPALIEEARGYFSIAYLLLNRAVFQPQRIKLPEDENG